jgi:diacylglycerol kinase (ATP)
MQATTQPIRTNTLTSGHLEGKPLRLGILSNDLSGGNRRDPDAVYRQVRDATNIVYHRTRTPAEISAALQALAGRGTDIIVVNGGDGTIQATFSALFTDRPFERIPPLALLSAGTTSMTAGDVGLHGNRSKAIQRLLHYLDKRDAPGKMQQRAILRVSVPGIPGDLYGMFFGTAAIYQAIAYCRRRVHSLGLKGEIGPGIALVRFMIAIASRDRRHIHPLPLTIGIDEIETISRDYLLVMASTLKKLFLGIRPFWGIEPEPLQFTGISVNPVRVIRALPSLLRGKRTAWMNEDNGYISRNVTKITMNLDSGFTLDGELFSPDASKGDTVLSASEPLHFIQV